MKLSERLLLWNEALNYNKTHGAEIIYPEILGAIDTAQELESALAEAKPKAYAFDKLFATLNELEPCDMTATDVLENMGKYFAEGLEATQ